MKKWFCEEGVIIDFGRYFGRGEKSADERKSKSASPFSRQHIFGCSTEGNEKSVHGNFACDKRARFVFLCLGRAGSDHEGSDPGVGAARRNGGRFFQGSPFRYLGRRVRYAFPFRKSGASVG